MSVTGTNRRKGATRNARLIRLFGKAGKLLAEVEAWRNAKVDPSSPYGVVLEARGYIKRLKSSRRLIEQESDRLDKWQRRFDCETCGEEYYSTRSDSHYCSSPCRQKAYRERNPG